MAKSSYRASELIGLGRKSKKPKKLDLEAQQKYEQCKLECVKLRDAIDNIKESENKTILLQESKALLKVSRLPDLEFDVIKKFKGHNGKIYDADWSSDCKLLLSGSQDGHLMIWDALSTMKKVTYQLSQASTWVMTCGFAPTMQYIACGGLDNICSIYKYDHNKDTIPNDNDEKHNIQSHSHSQHQQKLNNRKSNKRKSFHKNAHNKHHNHNDHYKAIIREPPYKSLQHHEGYLSSLQFLSDEHIITASGDSQCILWDVIKGIPQTIFYDHSGDVTSLAINKSTMDSNKNEQIFISGSVDATIKLWDIRQKKCVGEFIGQDADSDVNAVCWFPDNYAFASGSDDGLLRMFDIRAYKQVNEYFNEDISATVTSVSYSNSGSILFAGYDDDPFGIGWDVAYSSPVCKLFHNQSVSSLKVAPNGFAILTSSWDKMLRLWVGK